MPGTIRVIIGLATLTSAAAVTVRGGEATNNWVDPRAFRATSRHEASKGQIPVDRGYITAGTNRFGFEIPNGFRLDVSSRDSVALVNRDNSCRLNFRVVNPVPRTAVEIGECKAAVLAEYPEAKIVEEFSQTAVGRNGPAMDLYVRGPVGTTHRVRVVFIPSDGGLLEFSVVSTADAFETVKHHFQTLLLTFRASDPDGRLTMPVLPDKS
jgi:hypothetical protein